MNMPTVSVIIPVYNVEQYLRECLDSVTGQTLREIEIICVNDGSTDKSLSLLQEYAEKDSRITVIDRPNGGVSAARNSGLERASGEFVYFLDSDDRIAPDMLETAVREMREKNLDLLRFDAHVLYENDRMYQEHSCTEGYFAHEVGFSQVMSGIDGMVVLRGQRAYSVCVFLHLCRRNLLEKNRIRFEEGIWFEDHLFTLSCMLGAERFFKLDQKLVYRRYREGSIMTAKMDVTHFLSCIRSIHALLAFSNSQPDPKAKEAIGAEIGPLWNRSVKIYPTLTEEEKALLDTSDGSKRYLIRASTAIVEKNQWRDNAQRLEAAAKQDKEKIACLTRDLAAEKEKAACLARDLAAEKEKTAGLARDLAKEKEKSASLAGTLSAEKKKSERLWRDLQETRRSLSFRIGRAVTFLPRKLQEAFFSRKKEEK